MRLSFHFVLGYALVLAWPASEARAAEAADSCTGVIAATPITIDTPGTWCLAGNLVHDQQSTAVTITSPDVRIDCNGFAIDARSLPSDHGAYGIFSGNGGVHIEVRNCELRGFFYSITAYFGATIEDNFINGGWVTGIYVEGDGSVIRRNRIVDLGYSDSGFTWAHGILGFGDMDIVDNTIDGLTATPGSGSGVRGIIANDGLEDGQTFVIRGNTIRGMHPDGSGDAIAISTSSEGALDIRDNLLFGSPAGNDIGIYCPFLPRTRISGNILFDFAMPVFGCSADAGNSTKPAVP